MRLHEASGSKTTGRTRTVVLNEPVLNREFESILDHQVDPRPHDSGELVVLRKADWTRGFGGLKLRTSREGR